LTIWPYIFSAELTKTHSFRLFFGDLPTEIVTLKPIIGVFVI